MVTWEIIQSSSCREPRPAPRPAHDDVMTTNNHPTQAGFMLEDDEMAERLQFNSYPTYNWLLGLQRVRSETPFTPRL